MGRKRKWALIPLLAAIAIGGTALDLLVLFPDRPGPGAGEIMDIEVPAGTGPKKLASLLESNGVIGNPGRFALWLRLSGQLTGVKAGEFRLADNLSAREIVQILSGRPRGKGVKVLIPEGFTLQRIGEALEQAGILEKGSFIAAATDPSLVKKLGAPGPTFEGYLFPDTYYFEPDATAEDVIQAMLTTFRETLAAVGVAPDQDLKGLVTLAAIVQAEAANDKEMSTIAGVYTNRLTSPDYPSRRLQADPTVAYGCEPHVRPLAPSCKSFRGRLTRAQLDDESNPYNTYRRAGLPPGPICAPGRAAIEAAASPEKVPYLFFVATPDNRGHTFSVTLAEHDKAVKRYWKDK